MTMQTITYRGQTVAAATVQGLFLCPRLARRPVDDPERTFVIYMGVYAADVLRGKLPGPYSDAQARRYARVALIPGELLEHDLPCLEDTARALHVPASELRQARAQYGSMQSSR